MTGENLKVIKGPEAKRLFLDILGGQEDQARLQYQMRQHGLRFTLDLSEIDFDALRGQSKSAKLKISHAEFPEGIFVDFSGCDFGDGDVSFFRTKFHGGVSFEQARFGKGDVIFDKAWLVNASFRKCAFEEGERLSFRGAFFNGLTDMTEMAVYKTVIDFGFASSDLNDAPSTELRTQIIGDDFDLSFIRCSSTELNFDHAMIHCNFFSLLFSEHARARDITFRECSGSSVSWALDGIKLDEAAGCIEFNGAVLEDVERFRIELRMGEESHANFSSVRFPRKGPIVFDFISLGGGEVVFCNANITGNLSFISESDVHTTNFDFNGARFGSTVNVTNFAFGGVPDFTGTVFSTHVSLHGVEYQYNRRDRLWRPDPFPANAAKLQRLKELAENNRDHRLALTCYGDEMRSSRWQHSGVRNRISDVLDVSYDLASNYGQSIARPAWLLVATWFLCAFGYLQLTPLEQAASYGQYVGFSMAMAFPFLPASGLLRGNEFSDLFGLEDQVDLTGIYLLMGIQGVLSVVLLFLIGLGLRNRFRI